MGHREFHLKHLRRHTAAVNPVIVFIVLVEELAGNVIVLSVDVVGFDFRFLLGWTVEGLRGGNKIETLKRNCVQICSRLPVALAAQEFAVFLFP